MSPQVSLAKSIHMVLTHLVATFLLLLVVRTMSEETNKGFESATNMSACGT